MTRPIRPRRRTSTSVDPQRLKQRSEALILAAGGRICETLPVPDPTPVRDVDDVVERALILHAMAQLPHGMRSERVVHWIEREGLADGLTEEEYRILQKRTLQLSTQERIDLGWYAEALWAIFWATGMTESLPFDAGVQPVMAKLCPNVQTGEDAGKLRRRMRLRPLAELYAMRDLYYRLHWWTVDARLEGEDTGPVREDFVSERRRALEWILDRTLEWDDVPLDT